jgi:hypothetical protein
MTMNDPPSVHSALPDELTAAVDDVVVPAGLRYVVHPNREPVPAASAAANDPSAIALIGPYRSADVAEAVEVSAPTGLPLLAPLATWAGVTRDDEPGCEDAARHQGTVFRMVARDTVVAERMAGWVRSAGRRAFVVAGGHEYGRQLDGQLSLAGLPRVDDPAEAKLVVLAGLSDGPEIVRAKDLSPLPVLAFDGVQGAGLGDDGREIRLALPIAPHPGTGHEALFAGVPCARRAAELVVAAVRGGAPDRGALPAWLRALGDFDDHGDPVDPAVWLWRAGPGWTLHPESSL